MPVHARQCSTSQALPPCQCFPDCEYLLVYPFVSVEGLLRDMPPPQTVPTPPRTTPRTAGRVDEVDSDEDDGEAVRGLC